MKIRITIINLYRDSTGKLKGKMTLEAAGLGTFVLHMPDQLAADVAQLASERTVDKFMDGMRAGLIENACE